MHRLSISLTLLCVPITASAGPVVVELVPIEFGFTSTLTPEPADIWSVVVTKNDNTDPIFSLDLAIPGNYVQSEGAAALVGLGRSGPILVAGVLPAADTYFSVPASLDVISPAFQPGTLADDESLLAGAFTITGNRPILIAREIGISLATLAVPAGIVPALPQQLGTAAVRTVTGPLLVDVVSVIVPEPTTASLTLVALTASTRRRNRSSFFLQADP